MTNMLGVQAKGPGEVGALCFILAVSRGERRNFVSFARDSHRVRGVFSVVSLLSPVESSEIPSEANELTPCFYALGSAVATGFFVILEGVRIPRRLNRLSCEYPNYLMKRLSRSWSRPTNDFMVRNLPNNSWISRFCKGFCAGKIGFALSTCKVLVSITR